MGYSYFFGRGESDKLSGHDLRFALAFPIAVNRISLGATVRYVNVSKEDLELLNSWTFDVGGLFKLTDNLHLGISGKNLVDPCERADRCGTFAPTTIGGGLSFGDETTFVLAADVDFDLTSEGGGVKLDVGGEYFLQNMIPLALWVTRATSLRPRTSSPQAPVGAPRPLDLKPFISITSRSLGLVI